MYTCDHIFNKSFTKVDLKLAVFRLKKNKSSAGDLICNEMLKAGIDSLSEPLLVLFNSIHNSSIFPTQWKSDILQPLHKACDKSDPNNFRGITVSSKLSKLFNQLLLIRLDDYCSKNELIDHWQLSGKRGARTSDHLMIVFFILDKYVKEGNGKFYCCFVDLRKAYVSVNRSRLFFELICDQAF